MSDNKKEVMIRLSAGQVSAIEKLIPLQQRGEKYENPGLYAANLLDIGLRARAVQAAKTAKETDTAVYNAAMAQGWKLPESLGEFLNRKQSEWNTVLAELGMEYVSGEWKRIKDADVE